MHTKMLLKVSTRELRHPAMALEEFHSVENGLQPGKPEAEGTLAVYCTSLSNGHPGDGEDRRMGTDVRVSRGAMQRPTMATRRQKSA